MRRAEKALFSTAFHEAGHAVAAVVEGIRFRKVTIRPDADTLGLLMFHRRPKWANPNSSHYDEKRARGWFESRARIALAGPMAEQHHTRRLAPRYTHALDDDDIDDFAVEICGGYRDEYKAWIEYLRLSTRNRLIRKPYWSAVKALAKELMKQETIGEAEARRIIGSALK